MADLYCGPVSAASDTGDTLVPLDEKIRHAYFWVVNNAIISPHYDIEYNDGPLQTCTVGDSKRTLTLPRRRRNRARSPQGFGCQTRNGLSVRNLMTLLLFSEALARFRGNDQVELEDLRQVLPFVLRDKLLPDPDALFFGLPENAPYRTGELVAPPVRSVQ